MRINYTCVKDVYGTRVPGDRGKFRTSAHMQPKYTVEEVSAMGARGATVATCTCSE